VTAFIELTCKLQVGPIKKRTCINVDKIVYFAPNGSDGKTTLIFLATGDCLVSDENYQVVSSKIKGAYYGTN
jgi:hypothetical protein